MLLLIVLSLCSFCTVWSPFLCIVIITPSSPSFRIFALFHILHISSCTFYYWCILFGKPYSVERIRGCFSRVQFFHPTTRVSRCYNFAGLSLPLSPKRVNISRGGPPCVGAGCKCVRAEFPSHWFKSNNAGNLDLVRLQRSHIAPLWYLGH